MGWNLRFTVKTDILISENQLGKTGMKNTYIAIIIARGGSKEVPGKNLPYEAGTLIPPSHQPVITDNFSAVNTDSPFDFLVAKLLWENTW